MFQFTTTVKPNHSLYKTTLHTSLSSQTLVLSTSFDHCPTKHSLSLSLSLSTSSLTLPNQTYRTKNDIDTAKKRVYCKRGCCWFRSPSFNVQKKVTLHTPLGLDLLVHGIEPQVTLKILFWFHPFVLPFPEAVFFFFCFFVCDFLSWLMLLSLKHCQRQRRRRSRLCPFTSSSHLLTSVIGC